MTTAVAVGATADRIKGALWGIFIADALSMPVHWYYDVSALRRDFGRITKYEAPLEKHPSSIMSLSNTGGHGRGGQSGRIIGDVINHGKHQYWAIPNTHYHRGMSAGENTLNALCARVVLRGIAAESGQYSSRRFLNDYVAFMTTPGSHNDTYAESYHRDFFKRWSEGVPPEECAKGTEGHNTASIGGFVTLPPVILEEMVRRGPKGRAQALDTVKQHLFLTHDSKQLGKHAETYAELLMDVAGGRDIKQAAKAVAKEKFGMDLERLVSKDVPDTQVIGRVIGPACYINDALPAVLYFAAKYGDSFEDAVLANTNAGGENCHRGSALGAIVGAAAGEKGIPRHLIEGLHAYKDIRKEIDDYVAAVLPEVKEL